MKQKVSYLVLLILLNSLVFSSSAATWFVYDGESIDDYTKIGGAHFDEVSEGDTIFVYNGNYAAFTVDKPYLTIEGEDSDLVRIVTGDSILIPSGYPTSGNGVGTILDGFSVIDSVYGVSLGNVGPAAGSTIRNCIFDGISYDDGIKIEADDSIFENNVVRHSTGIYSAAYVWAINCTLRYNDIYGNDGSGLDFYDRAQETTVAFNNIHDNGYAGFEFWNAVNVQYIYLNNIFNNGVPATTSGTPVPPVLYWNTPESQSYVYNGNAYYGRLGNYWGADYDGLDADGDGIGDTPFELPEGLGYDYAPLMAPFENYEIGGELPAVLTADFTADVTSGDAPLTVQFSDASTGDGITDWAWDFDNDGTVDSTDQNPACTYDAAGTYTVSLTVTNACGCDDEVKEAYICVNDGPSPVPEFPTLALPAALVIGILGVAFGLQRRGVQGRK